MADDLENLSKEIEELRLKLAAKEDEYLELTKAREFEEKNENAKLTNEEITRYSRQLLLPNFGVTGQLKLKKKSFLIVGMGGLGCPAANYLVAAGVEKLGIVDYDTVDCSNIHRQTLHTEYHLGLKKVESAHLSLGKINSDCQIQRYPVLLKSENALQILGKYDVVLDCSDNVATRYLLNDACVMLGKPLVSGSALQLDGQLTVYHYGDSGPCYRCLYPVPPPPESVTNCSDGGVLGAVTGIIGAWQALEAIKIAVDGLGDVLSGRLLIFDGRRSQVRQIKLRPRRENCAVCSTKPTVTRLLDYEQFCGMRASDKDFQLRLLPFNQRISAHDYNLLYVKTPINHLLIDVRQPNEFEICHLPNSINLPLKYVLDDSYIERFGEQLKNEECPVFLVCRRGNDSQIAVQHMRVKFRMNNIRDIIGGLHAWNFKVDSSFPIY